ncbi:MAG: hypothetical protein L6Q98_09075 [Anaerolineae bacterium]|nr:hypothetical protein [Anaerolineae bacterium]NUQ03832.1 hypothetical protein [Anaerolineae bacterium]
MLLKRLVVWAVSMVLGFAVATFIVIVVLPSIPVQGGHSISLQQYGGQYLFWTGFPIGLIFVVWLDALLGTSILPE